MRRCDVLIVGGGPAGSTCARRLRRAGADVVVVDKCAFPRDKPCAGWITPPVLELLELDPTEYGQGRVLQPIRGFGVARLGGRLVENDYGRVVSYGIRRCEFDQYLLALAGAECSLGHAVRSIERVGPVWRLDGEFEAPLVVGAGGHACPVARFLGSRTSGPSTVVAAQEVEFELSEAQAKACAVRAELPELYFCEDLQGYGWCFRKGDHLNIGLGREDGAALSHHVQDFVRRLQQSARIPADIPPRFRGHAYGLYGHLHRAWVGDGMLTVGDAAGLAAAYSGEGIRAAVESGLLAAETIVAATGRCDRDALRPHADRIIERFGRPESADGWLQHVPPWIKVALAGRLFASSWFTRRVVLDRWFLSPPADRGERRRRPRGPSAA